MSEKTIVLWGFLIVLLVGVIYFIGIKYEGEFKYINLKTEIKSAVKDYVKEEDIDLPLEITTEELEEKGYIKELKLEDKVCAATIKVDKKFIFYNYDIKFECINVTE